MKLLTIATVLTAALLFIGCNDPEETNIWPDGARFWLGGVYADTALSWSPYGDILFFSAHVSSGASRLFGTNGLSNWLRWSFFVIGTLFSLVWTIFYFVIKFDVLFA
mgnify:CR=1 FL=1